MTPTFNPTRLLLNLLLFLVVALFALLLSLLWMGARDNQVAAVLLFGVMCLLAAGLATYWRGLQRVFGPSSVHSFWQTEARSGVALLPTVLTLLTLLLGLAITLGGVWWQDTVARQTRAARFEQGAERDTAEVIRRLNQVLSGLRGISGAMAINPGLRRQDFHTYVNALDIETEFPGSHGFGFVQRVAPEQLAAFASRQRASGVADFALHGSAHGGDSYVITYAEPAPDNQSFLGLDLAQDQPGREALEYAVNSGQPSLLSQTGLSPAAVERPGGFLLFLPVYRSGSPLLTDAQRKSAALGVVYAPVVPAELLGSMGVVMVNGIDFELFDGATAQVGALMYSSRARPTGAAAASAAQPADVPEFVSERQCVVGSHVLTLRLRSGADFDASQGAYLQPLIAGAGMLISALLAFSVWLLAAGRQRAQDLAGAVTAELDRMAQVVQHTDNAVTIMDRSTRIVWVNQGFTKITGYSLEEARGRTPHELLGGNESDQEAIAILRDAVVRGVPCRVEVRNRGRDGREYWAETEMQPTFDAHHNVIGFMEIGTDISHKKLTQQRLETAMRDASALLATLEMHAIVSTADRDGNITDVNAAFCNASGYSRDELVGQNYRVLGSGVQTPAFWQHLWTTIASGRPWRGEICNRTRAGQLYWLDCMIAPFVGSDGQIEKYVSIQTDITERHAVLERLRQSEATFYASFHNAAIGMAFLSPRGQWETANPAMCEFFGYSESALHELTFYDTSHPDEWRVDQQQIERLVAGEIAVYQRAKRFVHRDGLELWGLASVAVVRGPQGNVEFIVVQIVDITARKRVEDALSVSNALMEESQRVARVGGWQINVGSDEIYWTSETYRIHETTPEDFHPTVAAGIADFVPDSRPRIESAMAQVIAQGESFDLELQKVTARGKLIDVRVTGAPTWLDGRVVRVSGIFQDITERKQYETSLQEARLRAEQATRSKGQFLANMSHEIRTPMNAILGMLKLLHNTELDLRQRDYAEKTEGAARSLLGLINDILDFSKVEAGKMTLDPQPFRLDRLLRDLSVILSSNVGAKHIEVLFDVDADIPKVLVADALRLQQVLINLGGNAVKFTSQGQVVIALRLLHTGAATVGIEFSVQDSGIGIAPENQSHIFTGFSQAEASTTRRFGGTGLGLAISQRIVELMGGTLGLHSVLGEGSTFTFALELPTSSDGRDDIADELHSAHNRRRVLIVEKNPVARTLLARVAQSWGWPTEVVASGEAALEMVAARLEAGAAPFEVLYLDWQLPGMDGWMTSAGVRQLHARAALAPPVIVMVSSNARDTLDQRTADEQASIDSFLVKPVTASMLLEAALAPASSEFRLRQSRRTMAKRRRLIGMRILVVEDNLVNQQVAEELLAMEGALVSLAANGQAGVDAIAAGMHSHQFDAVLMDIQMPILDGYAATRIVRDTLGLRTLPIIAMTANAMASDRQECLAAGMDEHVGKPFELNQLVATLLRVSGFRATPDGVVEPAAPPPPVPATAAVQPAGAIDVAGALARMGGLTRLYLRSVRDFVQMLPNSLAELQQTLPADLAQARLLAHTIKGTSAMLGATQLSAAAAELEKLCKQAATPSELDSGQRALAAQVQQTLEQLQAVLQQLDAGAAPGAVAAAPVPASTPGAATMRLHVREAIAGLVPLLQEDDLQVLEKFANLRAQLADIPAELFAPLETALQGLDSGAALAACARIQEWTAA